MKYTEPNHDVVTRTDMLYGQAPGYRTSMKAYDSQIAGSMLRGMFNRRITLQDLTLDLYLPKDFEGPRPLILFIHGGAFWYGDKSGTPFRDFCEYFASLGYVTASINYCLGFRLRRDDLRRAEQTGMQDAQAALKYLLAHADEYGIDKDNLFACGSSAGAVIALGLAFNGSPVKLRAIANLWGYMHDTSLLQNSGTSIISFHGDADQVVPLYEGYPMGKFPGFVKRRLMDKVYGSAVIDREARKRGLRSELYVFPGEGHALNQAPDHSLSPHQETIKKKMAEFFQEEIESKRS